MMQKVQGLIFAVCCLEVSLLFHLSLTVRGLYCVQEVSFLSPILSWEECFSFVGEVHF